MGKLIFKKENNSKLESEYPKVHVGAIRFEEEDF